MKLSTLLLATALAAGSLLSAVTGDTCSRGATEIGGNWYCGAVDSIKYTNVGYSGTYNEVTHMGVDGSCATQAKHHHGSLAPLNEELSLHVRGPVHIKQFAAFTPETAPSKANKRALKRHPGHLNHHPRTAEKVNRAEQIISGTVDGQVVSWTADPASYYKSDSSPPGTSTSLVTVTTTTCPAIEPATTGVTGSVPKENIAKPTSTIPDTASSSIGDDAVEGFSPKSSYKRISYYNAENQMADNVMFLGNHGGQGSGVFDVLGASLSYVDRTGRTGSASPAILADVVIPSASEIGIFTSQECGNDCGFVRPGGVAYHGFGGDNKVFLLEIQMPRDGETGFQGDLPGIWMLNAKIPRTVQYPQEIHKECSCWYSGCGEVDLLEALDGDKLKLKSCVHDNFSGGSSDYFVRPTESTATYLIIFRENTIYIGLVDNLKFPNELTSEYLNSVVASYAGLESEFRIAQPI
ncbi:unnamed protein product [Diplocarpon coronariae]|uniref:glucan endo-1,3-beta-D-glucosidase n=1 Tax=Diplocarpon coronariae TaxID=2795749 RepID=A0A218Z9H7_9HELO|nr:protein TOS1 precursor [Marssonina coronariae]